MPQVLQLGPAKGVAGLGLDLIKLRENALPTRSKALRRLLTYPARPAKPGFPRGNGPYSERRQRIEVWMTLVKSLFEMKRK